MWRWQRHAGEEGRTNEKCCWRESRWQRSSSHSSVDDLMAHAWMSEHIGENTWWNQYWSLLGLLWHSRHWRLAVGGCCRWLQLKSVHFEKATYVPTRIIPGVICGAVACICCGACGKIGRDIGGCGGCKKSASSLSLQKRTCGACDCCICAKSLSKALGPAVDTCVCDVCCA